MTARNPLFFIITIISALSLWSPEVVFAQGRNLQTYISAVSGFLNNTLIPFFFALAIMFLLVNVTRYFVIEAGDASAKEKARTYIIYAIIGLVFISSIWGIINIIIHSFGVGGSSIICPDYHPDCAGQSRYWY